MADTPTQADNLGQYAKQAYGADYAQAMASTFGAYVAADMAIRVHANDVRHTDINQQAAKAFEQDMKAVIDNKIPGSDREALLAQVETMFGTHGAAAKEFLKTYYDGVDNKNPTVQQTGWTAFIKEVNAADLVAYNAHAKDHTRGAVAAEGSGEFVTAFGKTAKLNEEIHAYAAARSAQAQGKNPVFSELERLAGARSGADLDTHMKQIVASQAVAKAAQDAIKAGVPGAPDDLTAIQNGMDKGDPVAVGRGTKKLLLDEKQFLAKDTGDLSTTLAELGITGGKDTSLGAPLPASASGNDAKQRAK